jgi:hypothetical protein
VQDREDMVPIYEKWLELNEGIDFDEEGDEKSQAEIAAELEVEEITEDSLKNALLIIAGAVRERVPCERELLEAMKESDPDYTQENAARVVKQFENSQYSDTIGSRKRSAWIRHLQSVFKNKFSKHPEYERLTQLLLGLE